jgi:hypothetical protein
MARHPAALDLLRFRAVLFQDRTPACQVICIILTYKFVARISQHANLAALHMSQGTEGRSASNNGADKI